MSMMFDIATELRAVQKQVFIYCVMDFSTSLDQIMNEHKIHVDEIHEVTFIPIDRVYSKNQYILRVQFFTK